MAKMLYTKKILYLFCVIFLCSSGRIYSQTEAPPAQRQYPLYLVIAGRLNLEKHGQEEWLVLHSRDAKTYLISDNSREKLKEALLKLGENNLVFLWAKLDGTYRTSCAQTYKYVENAKKERELKTSVECIRYYLVQVLRIAETKKSDEPIPPAQRDSEEERRVFKNVMSQAQTPSIVGEIYGEISSLSLKTAFKTVQITNRDKTSPIKDITLVISPDTRIVKKVGQEEPMALGPEALQTGQEVAAMYAKDELKTKALFITITKE